MISMRNSRPLSRSLALLAACILALASLGGCGEREPDARLKRHGSEKWASAPLKVYPVGEAFELEGCTVKLHRIAVGGRHRPPDVTLATASCPTAQVTAQASSCGIKCRSEAIQVTPKRAASDTSSP